MCSVPQAKTPCIRVLGFFTSDEAVLSYLDRLRADTRVNRLPILIGLCNRRGIVGMSLSRAMHANVVMERNRLIYDASQTFEQEKKRVQMRKNPSNNLEYGMSLDYFNRVLRAQQDLRTRFQPPREWTPRAIFSFLLHNARVPDGTFNRAQIALRL